VCVSVCVFAVFVCVDITTAAAAAAKTNSQRLFYNNMGGFNEARDDRVSVV